MMNLAHYPLVVEVVETESQVIEDLKESVQRLEEDIAQRDKIDLCELEGIRARIQGQDPDSNPYELSNLDGCAWNVGFQQTDQEMLLQNVVLVAQDVLETVEPVDDMTVRVDAALLRILAHAVNEAKKYII